MADRLDLLNLDEDAAKTPPAQSPDDDRPQMGKDILGTKYGEHPLALRGAPLPHPLLSLPDPPSPRQGQDPRGDPRRMDPVPPVVPRWAPVQHHQMDGGWG